jgi:hypothetical protein
MPERRDLLQMRAKLLVAVKGPLAQPLGASRSGLHGVAASAEARCMTHSYARSSSKMHRFLMDKWRHPDNRGLTPSAALPRLCCEAARPQPSVVQKSRKTYQVVVR